MHFTSSWLTTPWVFYWSFAGCGGVKAEWTCRITLSVLWHLLITVYKQFAPTSVIHFLLNVDSISFKRDPEVTHMCIETITRRTMSRAGRCHTEVNMEVTECNACGFIYTNSSADEDEKKERDVLIIVFCRTMAVTNVNFTWTSFLSPDHKTNTGWYTYETTQLHPRFESGQRLLLHAIPSHFLSVSPRSSSHNDKK